MNSCTNTPTNTYAQDPVTWLRAFILVQLTCGRIDARLAEVAMSMVEQLRLGYQMGKMGQALVSPVSRPHATAKAVPLPAATSSSFFLHDHYSREGRPLRLETTTQRQHRREVANWRGRSVEELLADMQQRKASRLAA